MWAIFSCDHPECPFAVLISAGALLVAKASCLTEALLIGIVLVVATMTIYGDGRNIRVGRVHEGHILDACRDGARARATSVLLIR